MKSVLIKSKKYQLKYKYYAREDGSIFSSASNKVLSTNLDKDGYVKVRLVSVDGRHTYSIHRLILENFNPIDNMENMQINHIDGNKQNNRLENLEWVTCSENNKHAHRIGLKNQKGEKNNASKLTELKVKEIIKLLLDTNMTQKEIGKLYGVSDQAIGDIKNHRRWKYLTDNINFN